MMNYRYEISKIYKSIDKTESRIFERIFLTHNAKIFLLNVTREIFSKKRYTEQHNENRMSIMPFLIYFAEKFIYFNRRDGHQIIMAFIEFCWKKSV